MALVLPLLDPGLPEYLRIGPVRLCPDQQRLLESQRPIQDQIYDLSATGILGNLASVHLPPRDSPALWIIETHAGGREERLSWLRAVIKLEGRSPIG